MANGYNTTHMEAFHKIMIKIYYNKTTKKDNFQFQLMQYNKQHVKILAMKDVLFYKGTKKQTVSKS